MTILTWPGSESDTLLNILYMCRLLKHRDPSPELKEEVLADAWCSMVGSDQQHYPIENTSRVNTVTGLKVVVLRMQNVTLPVVSQQGPLVRKMLLTLHCSTGNNGTLSVSHIIPSTLRHRFLTSEFGLYTFCLGECISSIVNNCGICPVRSGHSGSARATCTPGSTQTPESGKGFLLIRVDAGR